jgi:CRISPR-associated protein Cas2
MRHLWLICYDISADSDRSAVEAELLAQGERVQYSVFEVWLRHEQLTALRARIQSHLTTDTDSVRYYPLCRWCQNGCRWQGQGRSKHDIAYWVL